MGSWCSLRHVSTTSGQVYTSEATVSHVSPAASNPSHRTRNSTWCVVGLRRWEVNRCTKLSGKSLTADSSIWRRSVSVPSAALEKRRMRTMCAVIVDRLCAAGNNGRVL